MEDIRLHEIEDDIHSSGHPAGHAVAGEYVHLSCYLSLVISLVSVINTIVAMQQIYCLLCASRHFLSNLGSLVDVHVILDSLQGASG